MTTSPRSKVCTHCGTPFDAQARPDSDYCCNGCAYVARMITEGGFAQYYDLRDRMIAPVKPAALQRRDYRWLARLQAEAEVRARPRRNAVADLDLTGISCVGCVWLIEKVFAQQPGIQRAEVNAQLGQVRLQWLTEDLEPAAVDEASETTLTRAAEALQQFGYLLQPPNTRSTAESQRLLGRVGLAGAAAMNAMLFTLPSYLGMPDDFAFAELFGLFTILCATLGLLAGGSYFIERAVRALMVGALHIDLPIALGLLIAYAGSLFGYFVGHSAYAYFDFVAIFAFLMLGGRWLQERAVERNRFGLRQSRLTPTHARVIAPEGGGVSEQKLETLQPGQTLEIGPGDLVPVRVRLPQAVETPAEVSLEWINGEAEPVRILPGQLVPAGAVNLGRVAFHAVAEETWEASLLRRLTTIEPRQVRDARLEAVLRVYLVVVLILALAGGLAWGLIGGDWLAAGQVTLSILVVSCPCALGVAYPLAQEQSVSRLRRVGVFIKEADTLQRLRDLRRVVFDKTGTLTLETPDLANPDALSALPATDRAALWRLVEDGLHPVSRALRESLLALGPVARLTSTPVEEVVGFGVTLVADSHRYALGRPQWVEAASRGELLPAAAGQGGAFDVALARDGVVLAQFRFAETVRDDAVSAVAQLRRKNLSLHILSGDRAEKVAAMAAHLGLPAEAALARLTPQEKADWVRAHDPAHTLFIGDGANDSLAFDAAGVRGTPVVDRGLLEAKADFYFLGRNLGGLLALLEIERGRRRAVAAVFGFAVTYNLTAVAVCLAGWMNPLLAAILMPLSSLVTVGLVQAILGERKKG